MAAPAMPPMVEARKIIANLQEAHDRAFNHSQFKILEPEGVCWKCRDLKRLLEIIDQITRGR